MQSVESTYAEAQRRVVDACAEAERLAGLAEQEADRLREARRERVAGERELDELRPAEPRALAEAKAEAHANYQASVKRATHPSDVMASASAWLGEIDRLNRTAAAALERSRSVAERLRQAQAAVSQLDLAARAAAISADSARQACLEARRALAREDEAISGHAASARPQGDDVASLGLGRMTPIEALLDGNRATFARLVSRLAEEAGLDASRMQLLLLELREGILARAFEAAAFEFPERHPFWSQFSRTEARAVAAALAALGRGFDGRSGWRDGRVADPRELAIALTMAGHDARTVRYRPTRGEMESLWEGTAIAATQHVHERAPDLGLDAVIALLGPRADGLADLWDNWGRLRRLLLGQPSTA